MMTANIAAGSEGDYPSAWGVSERCCEGAPNNSMQLTALVPQLMSAVKLGRDLLKQFGSLRAIVQAPVTALLGVKGMLDV